MVPRQKPHSEKGYLGGHWGDNTAVRRLCRGTPLTGGVKHSARLPSRLLGMKLPQPPDARVSGRDIKRLIYNRAADADWRRDSFQQGRYDSALDCLHFLNHGDSSIHITLCLRQELTCTS